MLRLTDRMHRRRRVATGIPGNGGSMNRVPLEQKVLSENDRIAGELRERFRENGILCLNLISSQNDRIAGELRERFRENGILCLNLISSPGAGKTLLLERTLESFAPGTRVRSEEH